MRMVNKPYQHLRKPQFHYHLHKSIGTPHKHVQSNADFHYTLPHHQLQQWFPSRTFQN